MDLVMAGWRHGTKRGRGARLFIVLLVYTGITCIHTGYCISITYIILAAQPYFVSCIFTSVSTSTIAIAGQETWHCKRWIV